VEIIASEDCDECQGSGRGLEGPCIGCGERTALAFLLTRIGSWTNARWDQHVRYEFGDDIADALFGTLAQLGVPLEKLKRATHR
jgi:hypothetical protein